MLKARDATEEEVSKTGLIHGVYTPKNRLTLPAPPPVVLLVHGRAGDANSMWTFSKTLEAIKPLVVSPQALFEDPDGGYSWWQVGEHIQRDESGRVLEGYEKLKPAIDALEHFVLSLPEVYQTDASQVYAFGFSQGAGLISSLSLRNPSLFRGVALLSGFLPRVIVNEGHIHEGVTSGKVALPQYLIAHGTQDKIVGMEKADFAKTSLEWFGANVEFHTEDIGHKVGSSGMKTLRAWIEGLFKENNE